MSGIGAAPWGTVPESGSGSSCARGVCRACGGGDLARAWLFHGAAVMTERTEKSLSAGSGGGDARGTAGGGEGTGYSIAIGAVGGMDAGVAGRRGMGGLVWLGPRGRAAAARVGAARSAAKLAAAGDAGFYAGRYGEAVGRYEAALELDPGNATFHYRLAYAALRGNREWLVERHLLEAVRLRPWYAAAHEVLGQWYALKARHAEAMRHSAAAVALEPGSAQMIVSRAGVLAGAGDAAGAWALLEPLMDVAGLGERVAIVYAQIAGRLGREREAAERGLAHLRKWATGGRAVPAERPQLLFALAGLLDGLGRYGEAAELVVAARGMLGVAFDAGAHARGVEARAGYFTAERMRRLPRATHGSERPVFVVGMPRSGTSLVEQILASHPAVYGAGELEAVPAVPGELAATYGGAAYPEVLDGVGVEWLNAAAGRYLAAVGAMNGTARYVTDKMPLNFLELGLIELLFPGSRVIHCVRDARDTCVSCYMTDTAVGGGFCRNFETLAGYYRAYARIMAHWREVLTVPVLEVRYEDVVADVEGSARSMLEFLGLGWDERCVRFHENRRPVATASREQVRKPLYASSVGRWRNYREALPGLFEALG